MPSKIETLDIAVQAYVQGNNADPLSFDTMDCMSTDLPVLQRRKFAFLFQNWQKDIEQYLGLEDCKNTVNDLKKKYKKTIDQDGGGFSEYKLAKTVFQDLKKFRDEARQWEANNNVPNDDNILVCKGGEVEVQVFYPLQHTYTRLERHVKAYAEAKAIHASRNEICVRARTKKDHSVKVMSNARKQSLVWYQSIEQGMTSRVVALMPENTPPERTIVLSAYLASMTSEKQMLSMGLAKMQCSLNFCPNLLDLHRYESPSETKWRVAYLKLRKELEGVTVTAAQKKRKIRLMKQYRDARTQTALKFVERWCSPDNEFVKILLKQLKSEVKTVNDRKNAKAAKLRRARQTDSGMDKTRKLVVAEGEYTLRDLMEAGKKLFNQQVRS